MIEALKQVRMFSALPEDRLAELNKGIIWQEVKKGERIFEEGAEADRMYIIARGQVKIVKEFPSGRNAIMGIFGPGGAVAEIVAVDKLPYPASAVALEDSTVGAVLSKKLVPFLKENPDALLSMIGGLASRLREMVDNIGSLAVQSVEKRVARFLVKLSDKIGEKNSDGIALRLPMTRQDLAEIIGTSFEVVERSLKKLREKGLIRVEGKKITILRPRELRDIFTKE